MLSFRESQSYLWYSSESDELGRGSFGTVFRGMNKLTGEPVAVKVPHSNVRVPEEIEQREIEVCQRCNHINVVKLLSYEEEQGRRHRRDRPLKVLIMELCDGGSLLKILEHPMNCFGLDEDEFLTVLCDLTAGMKYMRENDIIHRDLKPANIMRCIADDGSSIYKITDFGAARELGEHQEYSSIFGTEEYLHPDVYEQALFPDNTVPKKKFSPSTDLWSIGATLYHVATGMLPFRPEGGRKNKRIMHLMTTKKESGVISAYQENDSSGNPKIIFEKHLPRNCMLSPDLKKLLCQLLAGLMEVDPRKKLTYESYFEKVQEILNRTQLHVFNFTKLQLLRLYINPSETRTYEELCCLIQIQAKMNPGEVILLFKDTTLNQILAVDNNTICSKLPQTSKTNPLILCNRIEKNVCWKHDKKNLKKKLFSNLLDYQKDADLAKHNCSVAYYIKRQIEDVALKVSLVQSAIQTINQVVVTQLTAASKENILIHKTVHSLECQFEMMKGFHSLCSGFCKLVPADVDEGNNFLEGVKRLEKNYLSYYSEFQTNVALLTQLKPSIDALLGSRVQNRFLMQTWEETSQRVKGVKEFARNEKIASTLVSNIAQSFGEISGDFPSTSHRSRRTAPEPEEQCLHLIERTKMMQIMDKLEKLQIECLANYASLNTVLSEWYEIAIAAYVQPEILMHDMKCLQFGVLKTESSLSEAVKNFNLEMKQITESLHGFPAVVGHTQVQNPNTRKSVKAIRARLQELTKVQEEIQSNFKVNIELCDQLQELLLNSFSDSSSG